MGRKGNRIGRTCRAVGDEIQVESSIVNTDYCDLTRRTQRLYCGAQLHNRFRPESWGIGMSPFASSPFLTDDARSCRSCASHRQMEFPSEICMHFPGGLESLDKPLVWAFPKIAVCLDCGAAQFTVPDAELKSIQDNLETAA